MFDVLQSNFYLHARKLSYDLARTSQSLMILIANVIQCIQCIIQRLAIVKTCNTFRDSALL